MTGLPVAAGAERVAVTTPAAGPAWWLRSYRLLLRRDLIELRLQLVTILIIQIFMGAGMAVIYGFMLGDLPPIRTIYVATGAPVLALVPVGAVMLPGITAQRKAEGSQDFLWSLPVPNTASAAATCTAFTAAALPGAVLAMVAAGLRYDLDLSVSVLVVPAVLLGALVMSAIGYGIGHAVEDPQRTNLYTNLVIFGVLMFSPISFPIEQFPDWLASVHRVLPVYHVATIIRAGLTDGVVTDTAVSFAVVAAWTVAGWALAFRAIASRR